MADIQAIIPKDIDFNNKRYVLVNAKQYDKQSRYILFSCYSDNEFVFIDKAAYTAFVRYKKADGYSVFNRCAITETGCVLMELTEQMLAASGMCCGDLLIVKGRSLYFDSYNGLVESSSVTNILSTMTFYVDVSETPIDTTSIESSDDYSGFNLTIEQYKTDISDVIKKARSWAEGGTGTRLNEDIDNAKYYYNKCKEIATGASVIGVKGEKEASFRTGNVNITASNVGAVPVGTAVLLTDVATVNEVKTYLGINNTNS